MRTILGGSADGQHLDELLRRCLVRLTAGGSGGTGFFVAPGHILTCAHVVSAAPGGVVEVALGSRTVRGTVDAVHPPAGGGAMYPYPDLAVVTVDPDLTEHGLVVLDEAFPALDDRLHGLGYGSTIPGSGGPEPATFTFDGLHTVGGGVLLRLGAGAQATAGMSGGPLLNLRTGRVCGVVKTTRDGEHPYGGWAVPIGALRQYEPQVLARSVDAHARDGSWQTAFAAAVRARPLTKQSPVIPEVLRTLLKPAGHAACVTALAAYEARLRADQVQDFQNRLHGLLLLAIALGAPEGVATLGERDATLLVLTCALVVFGELMPNAELARLIDVHPELRRRWSRHVDRTRRLTWRAWERVSGLPGNRLPDPARLAWPAGDLDLPEQVAVSLFVERELPAVVAAAVSEQSNGGATTRPSEPFPACNALVELIAMTLDEPPRAFIARCVERFEGVRTVMGTRPLFVNVILRMALGTRRLLAAGPAGELISVPSRLTADHGLWELQQLVADVQPESEADGEVLRLILRPEHPSTVEALLAEVNALRQAVDQGTATLAQYYVVGREAGLRLRYPRIRSNIDDPAHYVRSHGFSFEPAPGRLTLDVASVLPLLVRPLYGDRPEIGVRELVQNGLDAVWSLRAIESARGRDTTQGAVMVALVDRNSESAAVLDVPPPAPPHWTHWLEIRDDGIGMTTDVVREHFLTIGGSFDPAEQVRSTVGRRPGGPLRIGRFGIGVLAGFLLGAEIQVVTRHEAAADGLHFVMREDTDLVELYRCAADVGTAIRVRLTEATYARLRRAPESWDWYQFVDPPVTRMVCGDDVVVVLASANPSLDPTDDLVWRRLDVAPYGEVYWTPSAESFRGRVYVNGILVTAPHRNFDRNLMSPVNELKQPVISIADRTAACSLNLLRTEFIEYPQAVLDAVRRDALRDQVAWYVLTAAAGVAQRPRWESPLWQCQLFNAGEGDGMTLGVPFVFTESHLIALVPELLVDAGVTEIYLVILQETWQTGDPTFAGVHQLGDLAELARALHAPVGLIRTDMFGGFGYDPRAAAISETFRFGATYAGGSVMSQLIPADWGKEYTSLRPAASVGRDRKWMVVSPPDPGNRPENNEHEEEFRGAVERALNRRFGGEGVLSVVGDPRPDDRSLAGKRADPPDLLTVVDRDLLTRLRGRGLLRVVPSAAPGGRNPTEIVDIWREYGLPPALPYGFDTGDIPEPAAADLQARARRLSAATGARIDPD